MDFDTLYREERPRALATLIRHLRDFDLAEDMLQEAFAAAVTQWPLQGMPANPCAWLMRRRLGIVPMRAPSGSWGSVPSVALRKSRRTSAGARVVAFVARVIPCREATTPAMIADAAEVPRKSW